MIAVGMVQNGKLAWGQNPMKTGKKMENGRRPEMAKNMAAKMEKWTPNMGFRPSFALLPIFPILVAIFRPCHAWGYFHFQFPMFGPGPVSHSVKGHFQHKATDILFE